MELKAGYKTTEFWISLLPFILLAIKQFSGIELEQGVIVDGIMGAFGVITAVAYIISRFKLKTKELEMKK